ncbi:MAG TPA: 3-deoxy-7-phosphoheptulonate synthase [Candidatus Acidoferrales bacterium]|nr:3-deoxy-7-phosphoheptulonate synthase [Candidatus Acidoferrales bacterium]
MSTNEGLENRNVGAYTPLAPPHAVKDELPVTDAAAEVVAQTRRVIRDIIHGRDRDRLLVVVGPCSIHDADAAYEYAARLKRIADATRDQLVLVMRTYFEKPRTTVGWKGLINDPRLDGSCDIAAGLALARRILLKINTFGVPCACEMLDPITPQYIADLVSWAAIGARTTESQTHREMASGLSMPVGFKNGTDGGLEVALNAMISARHEHSFLGINNEGITAVVKTRGNPDRHVVLRGGGGQTNFSAADIRQAAALVRDEAIARPIMVDCSHGNSAKDYTRQGQVFRDVVREFSAGDDSIMGLLMESNLKPGKQTWIADAPLAYGVSITDACIGWEETQDLLLEAATQLAARPGRTAMPVTTSARLTPAA